MSDLFKDNLPVMHPGEAVEALSGLYAAALKSGNSPASLPAVMLWGPPGVGKSQAVHQMAEKVGRLCGRRVNVRDVRLLLFNPIDLRGIPTANAEKTLAVWLKPAIFDMEEGEDVLNLLFLDEISAAPPSVQAAAYQITLDRVIGEHRLPDNCLVLAAGNRVTDRSVAYKMPRALANRMLHILISSDFEGWRTWAVSHNIHPKVLGFLAFRRGSLLPEVPGDDLAFPTPRSWEMVSNLLHTKGGSVKESASLIAGLVGSGTALEFMNWEEVYQDLPDIADIFKGKEPPLPKDHSALYALTAAMTDYARSHREDMEAIAHSIRYADSMPPDYSAIVMRDYMALEEGYREKLMKIQEFKTWLEKKGVLMNGII